MLRENINKIHGDLLDKFYQVEINEKFDRTSNYFELSINENNKKLIVRVDKKELESNDFNWRYAANPLSQNSIMVERYSNVNSFINDVCDIFDKNRFDSEYINNLK
jgi:hypothetical protein